MTPIVKIFFQAVLEKNMTKRLSDNQIRTRLDALRAANNMPKHIVPKRLSDKQLRKRLDALRIANKMSMPHSRTKSRRGNHGDIVRRTDSGTNRRKLMLYDPKGSALVPPLRAIRSPSRRSRRRVSFQQW